MPPDRRPNRSGTAIMKNMTFVAAGTLAIVATYPAAAVAGDMNPSYYAGVFAGADFFRSRITDTNGINYPDTGTIGDVGLLAGIRLHQGDWFYGGEVDGSLSFGQNIDNRGGGCGVTSNLYDWCDRNGSLHARAIVGRSIGKVDIFASGGLAAAFMKYEGDDPESVALVGYSLGVGAEIRVNDSMSVRVEGLHDHFADHTFNDGYVGRWSQTTVRAGAVFHFN